MGANGHDNRYALSHLVTSFHESMAFTGESLCLLIITERALLEFGDDDTPEDPVTQVDGLISTVLPLVCIYNSVFCLRWLGL